MLGSLRSSGMRAARRQMSTALEGDTGAIGTSMHHGVMKGLALLAPLYFLTPDSYTDGKVSKGLGLVVSAAISAHSWVGLNYVCRDYVPKISSKLLGPARIATVGFSAIMFLGMAKISTGSPGGLKGLVKGLWIGKSKEDAHDF